MTRPCVEGSSPAIRLRSVLLPEPLGPLMGKELAGRHLQAHVAQCGDRVAGITVALADPLENDRRGVRHDLTRSGERPPARAGPPRAWEGSPRSRTPGRS